MRENGGMEYDLNEMRRACARVRCMLFPRNFESALRALHRRSRRGNKKRGQIPNKIGGGVTERVLLDNLRGVRTDQQVYDLIHRHCSLHVCRSVLNLLWNLELAMYEELGSTDEQMRTAWGLESDASAIGVIRLALSHWREWHDRQVTRHEELKRLRAEARKRRPS